MIRTCGDRNNVVFIIVRLVFLLVLPLPASSTSQKNVTFSNGFPENFTQPSSDAAVDVQYASCKIITDNIVATAEGKFSRFCHGICNINETNARLHRIETMLTADAERTRLRLLQLERIFFDDNNTAGKRPRQSVGVDTGRFREIDTYNGTVFSDGDKSRVFVYYWRVEAFWRLTFADGRQRSAPFYVSPRSYRIALTVHSDVTARTVRVAAVSATGEYDAQLGWPFAHRLRLAVLDQTDVAPQDIVSRVWDDVRCVGGGDDDVCASMEFRHDVLTYRRYAVDGALFVKVTVFLQ